MKRFYTLVALFFILSKTQANSSFVDIGSSNSLAFALTEPTFTPVGSICRGDFLNPLPTTSLNGITGIWSPALDNTVTKTYFFTPNSGQDATSTSMTIVVNAIPTTTIFCDSSNMPFSLIFDWAVIPGVTSYQYSYTIDGGQPITGSTFISNYQVLGLQANQSVIFTLTNAIGLPCFRPITAPCGNLNNSDFETSSLSHFPNPVNDILNISYNEPINTIEVFSVVGQQVFSEIYNSTSIQLPLSRYKAGIYFIKAMVRGNAKIIRVVKK